MAAYLDAAKSLGKPILVISNSEHSLVPEIAHGITVDFDDPESALSTVREVLDDMDIACVIATDDSCVALASRIAGHYRLPQNSLDTAKLTQRKDLGREALQQAGCETPDFRVMAIDEKESGAGLPHPVVLKPLGLAASRGVIRANNDIEFSEACSRIDAILETAGQRGFLRDHILVESYLDGDEYAVEGFMQNGEFHLLTIFDKPEPLTGPYFEETYYLTPTRLSAAGQESLVQEVTNCCAAYGLQQGPVHAEVRFIENGPVLLELAARTIGGQCGQLIEFSLGHKLEELVIQGMCNELPDRASNQEAAGVLMIPIRQAGILKRVEGMIDALQTPYVRDIEIHISPGYELVPLPEGSSYLGFIFAQAPDFDSAYRALQLAHEKLGFITQPRWGIENTGS